MQHNHESAGYERRDVNVARVGIVALISIAIILVCIGGLHQYYISVQEKQVFDAVLSADNPALREQRVQEQALLNEYKLIDAKNGVYQIPIDQAMNLLAREGGGNRP